MEEEEFHLLTPAHRELFLYFVKIAYYYVLAASILCGNMVTVITIWKCKEYTPLFGFKGIIKSLNYVDYGFLGSHMFADFLLGVVLFTANSIATYNELLFATERRVCLGVHIGMVFSISAVMANFLLVSIDRIHCARFPASYQRVLDAHVAAYLVVMLSTVWLLATANSLFLAAENRWDLRSLCAWSKIFPQSVTYAEMAMIVGTGVCIVTMDVYAIRHAKAVLAKLSIGLTQEEEATEMESAPDSDSSESKIDKYQIARSQQLRAYRGEWVDLQAASDNGVAMRTRRRYLRVAANKTKYIAFMSSFYLFYGLLLIVCIKDICTKTGEDVVVVFASDQRGVKTKPAMLSGVINRLQMFKSYGNTNQQWTPVTRAHPTVPAT